MSRTVNLLSLLWALSVAYAAVGPCFAENWPGFRGPTGQGISHEKNLPLTWSLRENLAWRAQVPGIGWSSPIVWEDRVFVTSATATYTMKTYTYKTVGNVKIQADVHRPEDAQPRPVLVWLHGGALMMGSKKWVQPHLMELCRNEGYCLVSANYRLAPQVKLPEIIEDLRDLMKWVNEKGPEFFHADASRIVVTGNSAGGYLTMMTGILQPRPSALVAYYGYGDVDGPWYTTPSEFYRKQPLVSKQDAYMGMTPEVVTEPVPGPFNRGRLYLYLRQNGLWTKEVTGFDPVTERKKLDPYCPVRNITPRYPPILMLHGTEDTDVPCQESRDMAEQLKKHDVRYEFFEIPGGNHGLNRGDKQMIDKAMARAREFIKEHLSSKPAPISRGQVTARRATRWRWSPAGSDPDIG